MLNLTCDICYQKLDKEAKADVDAAVEEAKASPFPEDDKMWTDVYVEGTEPPFMRGREREEVSIVSFIPMRR